MTHRKLIAIRNPVWGSNDYDCNVGNLKNDRIHLQGLCPLRLKTEIIVSDVLCQRYCCSQVAHPIGKPLNISSIISFWTRRGMLPRRQSSTKLSKLYHP